MKKSFLIATFLFVVLIVSLSANASHVNGEFDRAVEKYGQGEFQEVIAILKGYVEKRPEPAAYWMIGYSLYKLKRFDEADEYFKNAYLIDPEFSPKQIEAFAPGIAEMEKDIMKRLKDEFEREITVPGEAPLPMPTFEPRPEEMAPPEKPAEMKPEPVPMEQPPARPVEQPPEQPEAQPKTVPSVKEPSQPPVIPKAQPPVRQPSPPGAVQRKGPLQMPGPEGMGTLIALVAGFGMISIVIAICIYLYVAFCFFTMAKKLNVDAPWLAFIPVIQIWTFVAVAGKPWWWIILLLIPLVGAILSIYLWMCIAENMGKNKWLGLLILIPVINLILPGYLAFSKSGASGGGRSAENEFVGGEDFDIGEPGSSDFEEKF